VSTTAGLPTGLRWRVPGSRLAVSRLDLAELVLRDPHIITGIDHSHAGSPGMAAGPSDDEVPGVVEFFDLWYTVGDSYAVFNAELRRAFTARTAAGFTPQFAAVADRGLAKLPPAGDLATAYLSPYFLHSTFALLGVPEADWPNLTKVARVVIHLFKERLRGTVEHSEAELRAFATVLRFLKALTDRLLAADPVCDAEAPFLTAARRLAPRCATTWPVAALIGQLLMAGIEPMVVGTAAACRSLYGEPGLRQAVQDGTMDAGAVAEEAMRSSPPFGNIFRWVREPCGCLGVPLAPGTLIAIDVAAVHGGCPARGRSTQLTFGRGTHYCLGANTARVQIAVALRQLVTVRPTLRLVLDGVRIDADNNLKAVRALPYVDPGGRS
jgi:cytochrome P450